MLRLFLKEGNIISRDNHEFLYATSISKGGWYLLWRRLVFTGKLFQTPSFFKKLFLGIGDVENHIYEWFLIESSLEKRMPLKITYIQ